MRYALLLNQKFFPSFCLFQCFQLIKYDSPTRINSITHEHCKRSLAFDPVLAVSGDAFRRHLLHESDIA